jgi:hypothetical protein
LYRVAPGAVRNRGKNRFAAKKSLYAASEILIRPGLHSRVFVFFDIYIRKKM